MCGICRYHVLYSFMTRVRASALLVDQIGCTWLIVRRIVARPGIVLL